MLDQRHLCEHTRYPGIDVDGGFAEWVVVPASIAWVNPPDFPPHLSAMMEPFGIAVHACGEGTGVAGQRVLVNGCGPIGLMAVAAARALGAHQVIAADLNPVRLASAQAMGASHCLNPGTHNLVKEIHALTNGEGVDVVIELTGAEAGLHAALDALRRGGGFPSHRCTLPPGQSGPDPMGQDRSDHSQYPWPAYLAELDRKRRI